MTIQQLKVLVIVMGVLIIAGLVTVGVTIANRLAAMGEAQNTSSTVTLRLPPGAIIVETTIGPDHMALRLETDQGPRIMVFDLTTGQSIRTVEIVPEAAP